MNSNSTAHVEVVGRFAYLARQAAMRSKEEECEAITAIVLSFVTIECFVNEGIATTRFYNRACDQADASRTDILIANYSAVAQYLQENGDNLEQKIGLLYLIFLNAAPEKSRKPMQDFQLLKRIRDSLVHARPETVTFDSHGILCDSTSPLFKRFRDLESRKLASSLSGYTAALELVSKHDVALWAISTAQSMVQEICRVIPDSILKNDIETIGQVVVGELSGEVHSD